MKVTTDAVQVLGREQGFAALCRIPTDLVGPVFYSNRSMYFLIPAGAKLPGDLEDKAFVVRSGVLTCPALFESASVAGSWWVYLPQVPGRLTDVDELARALQQGVLS